MNGLVLNYDFGNFQKAFGTTNLIPNTVLSIYNNVPSHVTASLTQTSETYKKSPVWALTLTPTTSTGVSYLTSANNPGIGVVTGGGGGTGGVYTGHSIFFKSSVPLYGPAPIYTQYSNIVGWQSTGNYDDMGDGWYRANVIWYDTVTRSDGKYWAINPASATLNVPMTIYWAAPFKESQNYSNFVSPYTSGTRGSGSGVVNLVSQSDTGGTLANVPTYNTANGGSLVFDGVDDYVDFFAPNLGTTTTVEMWAKVSSFGGMFFGWSLYDVYTPSGTLGYNTANSDLYGISAATVTSLGLVNNWKHYVFEMRSDVSYTDNKIYINGVSQSLSQQLSSERIASKSFNSGNGRISGWRYDNGYRLSMNCACFKVYNRALTQEEVSQNFNALRGRYGI